MCSMSSKEESVVRAKSEEESVRRGVSESEDRPQGHLVGQFMTLSFSLRRKPLEGFELICSLKG